MRSSGRSWCRSDRRAAAGGIGAHGLVLGAVRSVVMRVAIPLRFNAPLGGLQDNVRATARFLRAGGHRPVIFCPPGPFAEEMRADGVEVWTTGFGEDDGLLDRLKMGERFDVVHAHPGSSRVFGLSLAQHFGCPFLITIHGRWLDGIHKYAKACAAIIAVSPAIKAEILRRVPAVEQRIEVIPNATYPVDGDQRWSTGKTLRRRVRALTRTSKLKVMVASRFDTDKRRLTDFLLHIWEKQVAAAEAGIEWQIAGTGSDLTELVSAAESMSQRMNRRLVDFKGWLAHEELARVSHECDVAVAPGRSAIDAMALGLVVVAVGSAGCAGMATPDRFDELAHANFGGFGLQTEVDAAKILDDLVELKGNIGRLEQISRASVQYVRTHFDQEQCNRRLFGLYEAALKG